MIYLQMNDVFYVLSLRIKFVVHYFLCEWFYLKAKVLDFHIFGNDPNLFYFWIPSVIWLVNSIKFVNWSVCRMKLLL